MNNGDNIDRIAINQLRQEEGAHELATSPNMEPYLDLIKAEMEGSDCTSELEAIRTLPLEKRYVWRVASALKWGFADFDNVNVDADRKTMTPEDLGKLTELLRYRPIQLCIFLKALLGEEEMQRMMVDAIKIAKRVG
jgi:hypothetical protein